MKSSSDDEQWKQINNENIYGRHMDDSNEKTLLFGGCKDGTIVLFEWMECKKNGDIMFTLQVSCELFNLSYGI